MGYHMPSSSGVGVGYHMPSSSGVGVGYHMPSPRGVNEGHFFGGEPYSYPIPAHPGYPVYPPPFPGYMPDQGFYHPQGMFHPQGGFHPPLPPFPPPVENMPPPRPSPGPGAVAQRPSPSPSPNLSAVAPGHSLHRHPTAGAYLQEGFPAGSPQSSRHASSAQLSSSNAAAGAAAGTAAGTAAGASAGTGSGTGASTGTGASAGAGSSSGNGAGSSSSRGGLTDVPFSIPVHIQAYWSQHSDAITAHVKTLLVKYTGEGDALLVEFVVTMLSNERTMKEVADEMTAFVGGKAVASQFAFELGEILAAQYPTLRAHAAAAFAAFGGVCIAGAGSGSGSGSGNGAGSSSNSGGLFDVSFPMHIQAYSLPWTIWSQHSDAITAHVKTLLVKYTGEGDALLVEFVVTMLSNERTMKEVADEMTEFLGGKAVASQFVTELVGILVAQYPKPSAAAAAVAFAAAAAAGGGGRVDASNPNSSSSSSAGSSLDVVPPVIIRRSTTTMKGHCFYCSRSRVPFGAVLSLKTKTFNGLASLRSHTKVCRLMTPLDSVCADIYPPL